MYHGKYTKKFLLYENKIYKNRTKVYQTKLTSFDNLYNCLLGGYTEAIEKTEEIGKDDIIKHEIIVKFNCYYDKNTLPKGA